MILVYTPLMLHCYLSDGIHKKHETLARTRCASAKEFLASVCMELFSPLRRRVK
jgi:hypothetical protein